MPDKKTVAKMEKEFKVKFPELDVAFYISKRNMCIHMGLDWSIFSYGNYGQMIAQINVFFSQNLRAKFIVNFPQLIHTTKWKYDYIICRKKKVNRRVDNWFAPIMYQTTSLGMKDTVWWAGTTKSNVKSVLKILAATFKIWEK